jgi:hypothetical protein
VPSSPRASTCRGRTRPTTRRRSRSSDRRTAACTTRDRTALDNITVERHHGAAGHAYWYRVRAHTRAATRATPTSPTATTPPAPVVPARSPARSSTISNGNGKQDAGEGGVGGVQRFLDGSRRNSTRRERGRHRRRGTTCSLLARRHVTGVRDRARRMDCTLARGGLYDVTWPAGRTSAAWTSPSSVRFDLRNSFTTATPAAAGRRRSALVGWKCSRLQQERPARHRREQRGERRLGQVHVRVASAGSIACASSSRRTGESVTPRAVVRSRARGRAERHGKDFATLRTRAGRQRVRRRECER